ncbi:MAG: hypothetical protein JRF62_13370 [Deltaproteobacteria bacterium]|nr:hypothetical protein [Deltaproteobacteria bacterium]MBW2248148.1 hypothetical protein [Deltaproteobacteria bacterium]MBW2597381.1 hypothetical protein [Deltaproteobacteria bacterium]MBW2639772.1 hypothetical protein [Deltaproteobacteria bacterium]MBW2681380.1 hypothetical protein [Deltaproteobacteria bacterium]
MKNKYVEVLQRVFDLSIRSRMNAEDMEHENIMNKLWKIIGEIHVMGGVK